VRTFEETDEIKNSDKVISEVSAELRIFKSRT